jgi:hypothetical protein
VNKLVDLVGFTLGPKGQNVVLESKYGSPRIVNDGKIEEIDVEEGIQEDEMDTSKDEEDIQEDEIREVSPRRDTNTPSRITQKNHLEGMIIGNKIIGVQTRRQLLYQTQITLLSYIEPNSIKEECTDENWVSAMNEEFDQIEKNQTWEIVPRPQNKNVIGTKLVFKNKVNENEKVIRNKPRLVCKGYS